MHAFGVENENSNLVNQNQKMDEKKEQNPLFLLPYVLQVNLLQNVPLSTTNLLITPTSEHTKAISDTIIGF